MDEKEYNEIVEHYSALEQKKDALKSAIENTDDATEKKALETELVSINEQLNLNVIEKRQREVRHALGRYTLEEASLVIQQSTDEWPSELQNKFKAAVLSGALPVYAPGKKTRYLYGNNFASCARVFYEEAYWNDLNEWLKKNEPRLEFRFQNPDAPAAKGEAGAGTTTEPVAVEPSTKDEKPLCEKDDDVSVKTPTNSGDEKPNSENNTEILAALFDPVSVEQLKTMFPADDGQWEKWADKAKRIGLIDAREGNGKFNPYKAGVWFVANGGKGFSLGQCRRMLANNHLPDRSINEKYLLIGEEPE